MTVNIWWPLILTDMKIRWANCCFPTLNKLYLWWYLCLFVCVLSTFCVFVFWIAIYFDVIFVKHCKRKKLLFFNACTSLSFPQRSYAEGHSVTCRWSRKQKVLLVQLKCFIVSSFCLVLEICLIPSHRIINPYFWVSRWICFSKITC